MFDFRQSLPIFIFILAACETAFSQVTILTWQGAVDEANTTNLEIQGRKLSEDAALRRVQGSRSGYLPSVSASLSTGRNILNTAGVTSSTDNKQSSISLNYNLFNGFADSASHSEAALNAKLSNIAFEETRLRIRFELRKIFIRIVFGGRSLQALEEIERRRQANLDLVRLQHEAGKENKGSLLLAEAGVEQAKLETDVQKSELNDYQQQLCTLLSRVPCPRINISQEVTPLEVLLPKSVDFPKQARETFNFQKREIGYELNLNRLRSTRAGFYPRLDFTAGISESDVSLFSGDHALNTGLTLTIPIFSGGSDYNEYAARRLELASSDLVRSHVLRICESNLRKKYADLATAIQRDRVEMSFLEAARLRAKIARGRYNAGLMTFEDWDRIEGELIDREKKIITSQRDRMIMGAEWEMTKMQGDIEAR